MAIKIKKYINDKLIDIADSFLENIEKKIELLQARIAINFASYSIFLVGFIFLSMAGLFLLSDNLNLPNSSSYLIMSGVIFLIGFILKISGKGFYK